MTATLLTGPLWLAEMFDGAKNSSNTAMIEVRWINELPYIAPEILTDPTYAEDLQQVIDSKTIAEWLTEIEIEIEIPTEE